MSTIIFSLSALMVARAFFVIFLVAVIAFASAFKCSDGFEGRCELNEPDFICDGGWGSTAGCTGLGRYGRCCHYPVVCSWQGFGTDGRCISKFSSKCPQGYRFADVASACPQNYWCCVKPAYRPPEPCQYRGRASGLCVWPEDQCSGDRLWGPCGIYRQCCTPKDTPAPTYGPPAPPSSSGSSGGSGSSRGSGSSGGSSSGSSSGSGGGSGTHAPPPQVGLYSLVPSEAASAYLAGFDGTVEFRALARDLPIHSVDFRVNGVSQGAGRPCGSGNDWCFSLNFKHISGASTLSAVPSAGPSVSYQIPLIKAGWLLKFLTGRPIGTSSWSGTFTEKWIDQKGSSGIAVPMIGFTHSWQTAATTSVTLSKGGTLSMSGTGSRSDTFKPDCCEGASGSFSVGIQLSASFVDIGGLVMEPQISSGSVSMSGLITMPTVYQFTKEAEAFGVSIGVDCGIDVTLGTSVSLGYVRDANNEFFGLPVALHSVSGTIVSIGASAHAKVHAGPLSAGVSASVSMGPNVEWTQATGLEWKGVKVNAKIGIDVDYFFSSAHITILSVSDTIAAKRNTYSPEVFVQISNFSRIQNVWNPVVTSRSQPYRVEDVYPSAFTGVASAAGYDVMVWSNFDQQRSFPHNLHVQYAVRQQNGEWSEPRFIPHSDTSVGVPALEDIESSGQIILVASQVTRSHPDLGTYEARLVESYFDGATQTWSPYVPLFDSHPTDKVDWLPVFSENGLWIAFIRAVRDTTTGSTYGTLTSSHRVNGRWTVPEVIIEESNPIVSFTIEGDQRGGAMLAYRTRHTKKVGICVYEPGSSWKCGMTDFDIDSSSTPSLAGTVHGYMLVWHVDRTINTVKLALNGTVVNANSLTLPDRVATIVCSSCDLAGPGSVVVGWTSWGANTTFAYALADPSAKLYHSPNNVAPQIETTSKTMFSRGSMQLVWTGSRLLYATMLSDNSTGTPRGTFAAFDLNFDAIAHISNPMFEPADFSSPQVTITVTLTNSGLRTIAAGGEVIFVFVTEAQVEYSIGVVQHDAPIASGESITVSVPWNTAVNTSEGGSVRVSYFGSDTTIADDPLYIDPAAYGISETTIASGAEERSTAVVGTFSTNGPASGHVELQAWTRLADGKMLLLGAVTHRVQPNSASKFVLPLTNLFATFSQLQVRIIGKHSKTTFHTTAYDSRYDFSLLLPEVSVEPPATANDSFVVRVPVRNLGTDGATVSVRAMRMDVATGGSTLLADARTRVEGDSVSNITLSLTLPMRLNMVMLEVNSDDQPLPELNTDNNHVLLSLQNQLGIVEKPAEDWTIAPTTTVAPRPTSSVNEALDDRAAVRTSKTSSRVSHTVLFVGVIVGCTIVAALLVLAAVILLLKPPHKPTESPYITFSQTQS